MLDLGLISLVLYCFLRCTLDPGADEERMRGFALKLESPPSHRTPSRGDIGSKDYHWVLTKCFIKGRATDGGDN